MYQPNNLFENSNMKTTLQMGCYQFFEHKKNLNYDCALTEESLVAEKIGLKKKQVLCHLNGMNSIVINPAKVSWSLGNIQLNNTGSDMNGYVDSLVKSAEDGTLITKSEYFGQGMIMLEPTFKQLVAFDVIQWGSVVVNDDLFLCCDKSLQMSTNIRNSFSEDPKAKRYDPVLSGPGLVILESPVAQPDMLIFNIQHDTIRFEGQMPIVWSSSMNLRVEKSTKMINDPDAVSYIFEGSGTIMIAP